MPEIEYSDWEEVYSDLAPGELLGWRRRVYKWANGDCSIASEFRGNPGMTWAAQPIDKPKRGPGRPKKKA